MKKIISRRISQIIAAVSLILAPSSAFATTTLCTIAQQAMGYFNMAIEVIVGLAIVVFVFNIYRYFFTTKRKQGARHVSALEHHRFCCHRMFLGISQFGGK